MALGQQRGLLSVAFEGWAAEVDASAARLAAVKRRIGRWQRRQAAALQRRVLGGWMDAVEAKRAQRSMISRHARGFDPLLLF